MLAQLEKPTHDFFALARYLVHGKSQPPHPDRVAWIRTHNLPIDDPDSVAKIMAATAARSRRCRHPCLHTIIAWHQHEAPSPRVMQEIAEQTLSRSGLAAHQALVMGHGDKAHPHLHMMVNRIHPETGKAFDLYQSHRLFDAIMRQLSDEYGFAHVPCHAFDPEATDDLPKKPTSAAMFAARHGAKTARPQWSRRKARTYAARVSEHLDAGSSWDDLELLFADDGLALEAKGKGWVVGNAKSYVKLSALGLQKTVKGFQKRRPPARRSRHPRPIMDTVDVARGLVLFGLVDRIALRDAIQEAQGDRLAWISRKPLIEQLLADLRKTLATWTAHRPPIPPRRKPKPHRLKRGSSRQGR